MSASLISKSKSYRRRQNGLLRARRERIRNAKILGLSPVIPAHICQIPGCDRRIMGKRSKLYCADCTRNIKRHSKDDYSTDSSLSQDFRDEDTEEEIVRLRINVSSENNIQVNLCLNIPHPILRDGILVIYTFPLVLLTQENLDLLIEGKDLQLPEFLIENSKCYLGPSNTTIALDHVLLKNPLKQLRNYLSDFGLL